MPTIATALLTELGSDDTQIQLWATDIDNRLMTTWKSSPSVGASWTRWIDHPNAPFVREIAAANLVDGRIQLWAVDVNHRLKTAVKTNPVVGSQFTLWIDHPNTPFNVQQIAAGLLPDRRVQLWALDMNGSLKTTVKTGGANSNWTSWIDHPGTTFRVQQVAAGLLIDATLSPEDFDPPLALPSILQLWTIDSANILKTSVKSNFNPNASWTSWIDHPNAPAAQQVATGNLSDGRMQLWIIDLAGVLWTTWKTSNSIGASWASWQHHPHTNFKVQQVAAGMLPNSALQLWVVDADGVLKTSWKSDESPNASWTQWIDHPNTPFRVAIH
jgi:hypothetical protein